MADALMALPDAVDAHQAGLHQCRALALGQFGMDDDVDVACFVFQCDEYCSFGGLGALTPGHYAAGPGQASVGVVTAQGCRRNRSEEHTSELQSLMSISYAVFCLKKKITTQKTKKRKSESEI